MFYASRQTPSRRAVWADRDAEQANGSLRQELVRLRRTIGEEVLPGAGTTSQPVRLDVTDVDIDVVRLRGAAAAPGGGAEAIALYSTSRDGR